MSEKHNNSYNNDEDIENINKNMTYYDVLGIPENATHIDIKKRFRKLAIKYHPDHKVTGDASLFALVARAYECLSNKNKRNEYDKMLNIQRKTTNSNFLDRKSAFDEFMKTQNIDDNNKNIAKNNFNLEWKNLDKKHGLDRLKINDEAMNKEDVLNKIRDLEMSREQDEIEFNYNKVFDDNNFDADKFNKLFELKHSKIHEIIKHEGIPNAFNLNNDNNIFVSCNDKYDNLYDEDNEIDGTELFSSFHKDNINQINISDKDIKKINSNKTENNYNNHNIINDNYRLDVQKRIKERNHETEIFNNRKLNDYNNNDETMGGYGFMYKVGLDGKELEWDKEEIDTNALQRLLHQREKELK
jgi:molecular chaperone DnaJ